jgi:hypothetical protein
LFTVLTVSVLGKESAIAAIKSFLYKDIGLQKASDNGYAQVVNYIIADNGVTVKVNHVVVDKTKMALSLQLDFDDASRVKSAESVYLDLVIRDDKGRPILEEGNRNALAGGSEQRTSVSGKAGGRLVHNLVLQSPEGKFDNIQALDLDIKSIALHKKYLERPYRVIKGEWKGVIKLDEQLKPEESVRYVAEENPMVKVISAEMLPTGMAVKFAVAVHVDESIMYKVTLRDDKGNVYKPSNTATMDYTEDGKDLISMTFDATSFDQLEDLTMKVNDLEGQEITVHLFKSPMNGHPEDGRPNLP